MHRQCHHLIHYDLPWSLIRIEQRNGRIDRYGQVHQPQFAALVLTSATEGAKDDTTVAEKLLKREATAHSQLGTAEGVTRQFTSKKEEDRLVKDLLAGKTVEQSIDEAGGHGPRRRLPRRPPRRASATSRTTPRRNAPAVPRLFASTEAVRPRRPRPRPRRSCTSTTTARCSPSRPPDDLMQRLSVLPRVLPDASTRSPSGCR